MKGGEGGGDGFGKLGELGGIVGGVGGGGKVGERRGEEKLRVGGCGRDCEGRWGVGTGWENG